MPGGAYDFAMRPNIAQQMREQTVVQAQETIERRVNELGVSEPNISVYGNAGDQLLVQLPGTYDVARAKEIIRSTAQLKLKIVEAGPASSADALLTQHGGKLPDDMEVINGAASSAAAGGTQYYLVKKLAPITGQDLRIARPTLDENGRPAVGFSLTRAGAAKFGKLTGENIGRLLAVILDNRAETVATIQMQINDEGRISGSFTQEEVADHVLTLNSGALPAGMSYLEERLIGATLGADSIRSGVLASLAGLVLVILFMLVVLQALGHQRHRRHGLQPDRAARPDGVRRRVDDAAGHRRVHPHDGHGRRLERADLRAHQGGAGGGDRVRARPSIAASTACS